MDEVERRLEVYGQHGVPLRLGHAHHQAVLGDAGVVHQDVYAAEVLHDPVDDLMRLFEIRRIRGIAFGLDAQRCDLGLGGLAVLVDRQVGERHIGALPMPRAAPVTTATFPSSNFITFNVLRVSVKYSVFPFFVQKTNKVKKNILKRPAAAGFSPNITNFTVRKRNFVKPLTI